MKASDGANQGKVGTDDWKGIVNWLYRERNENSLTRIMGDKSIQAWST
jgi:hypothetical protein